MSAINDAGASPASPSSPLVQTLGLPTVAEAAPVARSASELLLDDAELQAQYAAAELAAWETCGRRVGRAPTEKEKAADAAYQAAPPVQATQESEALASKIVGCRAHTPPPHRAAGSSAAARPPAAAAARRPGDDGRRSPTRRSSKLKRFKHDANGDGVLDIEEFTADNALLAAAAVAPLTAVDINSYFRQADADASGTPTSTSSSTSSGSGGGRRGLCAASGSSSPRARNGRASEAVTLLVGHAILVADAQPQGLEGPREARGSPHRRRRRARKRHGRRRHR